MLKMVTVTGADDSVKPSDLAAVAAEYPFVEFGILFRGAENRTKDYPVISGKSRFPSFDWLMGMLKISESQPHLDLSCHLCGQAARDFLEGVFLAAPQPNGRVEGIRSRSVAVHWHHEGRGERHRHPMIERNPIDTLFELV